MASLGIGALVSVWCCAALAQANVEAALRPQSARLRHAVEWSIQESITVHVLADTLAERHVVVWIEAGSCDRGRHDACLQHRVTISGDYRYLFILVRDDLPKIRVAGLIAHELQHAIEVADAGIARADDFDALYRRIGQPCERQLYQDCWETTAAISVQDRVLAELTAAAHRTGR